MLYGVGSAFLFWQYRQLELHIAKVQQLQANYASYIAFARALIKQKNGISNSFPFLVQDHNAKKDEKQVKKDEVSCNVSQNSNANTATRLKRKQEKRELLTNISFARPMKRSHYWLSSYFGPRKKPNGQWGFHYGLDMAAHRGTPIKSVANGIVEIAETASGFGNTIVIAHDEVYKSRYAHLDEILVSLGQHVVQGELIGKVGDTGNIRKIGKDGSHLHLELYENSTQINPMHVIDV